MRTDYDTNIGSVDGMTLADVEDKLDTIELKNEILENGNRQAYVKFFIYQYKKEIDKDFLRISLDMYHKYNYNKALSDIYLGYIYKHNPKTPFLTGNVNELFVKIPKNEQEKVLNYLEIGVEKGEDACISHLIEYYDFIGETQKSKDLTIYQDKLFEDFKKRINDSISKSKIFKN